MEAQMYNFSSWIEETDVEILMSNYNKKLINAGFNILDISSHKFEPQGYTSLFLLSESHFAIHTFPEHNKSYIELSSCVKKQFDRFVKDYA